MKEVDWTKWSAIAEILGSIIVAISLLFVGLQIRANTISTRAAAFQANVEQEIGLISNAAMTPETAGLYFNPPDLTDTQSILFLIARLRMYENFFLQHEWGLLTDEQWQAREFLVRESVLLVPPVFFGEGNGTFSESFSAYVRSLREETQQ